MYAHPCTHIQITPVSAHLNTPALSVPVPRWGGGCWCGVHGGHRCGTRSKGMPPSQVPPADWTPVLLLPEEIEGGGEKLASKQCVFVGTEMKPYRFYIGKRLKYTDLHKPFSHKWEGRDVALGGEDKNGQSWLGVLLQCCKIFLYTKKIICYKGRKVATLK